MPCKRTASDAELGAPEEGAPVPELPADVLGVIFSFCLPGWYAASCARPRDDGTVLGVYGTMRLVCKQWARVAGAHVRNIRMPLFGAREVAIASAFPRVLYISTGSSMHARGRDLLEGVLARYAALGTRVCVVDERLGDGVRLISIDAHGHLGRGGILSPGRCRLVNTAFPFVAWPSERDPSRLIALFATFSFGESPFAKAMHHGIALANAHMVSFISLYVPADGGGFRADTVYLNYGVVFGARDLATRFPPESMRALVDPERWVNRRLPALCVVCPLDTRVDEATDAIRRLIATVAPLPVTVYAWQPDRYNGCGCAVYPHTLFHREFR